MGQLTVLHEEDAFIPVDGLSRSDRDFPVSCDAGR
jgi:hypothetical protein